MAENAFTFICQNCGAVYAPCQDKCEACGQLGVPRPSFASLLMAIPFGDFELDRTPVRVSICEQLALPR